MLLFSNPALQATLYIRIKICNHLIKHGLQLRQIITQLTEYIGQCRCSLLIIRQSRAVFGRRCITARIRRSGITVTLAANGLLLL